MQSRRPLILLLVLGTTGGAFGVASGQAPADPAVLQRRGRVAGETGSRELEAAMTDYRHGDYSGAYQRFYPLANAGNPEAQYLVGYLHDEFHLGMTQDYATALRWYRVAAEQGHPKARFRLGYAYEHGRGVAQDLTEAARWYQAAAAQGSAEAQAALGRVREVQGLDAAITAYERGDHRRAFTLLTDLANERNMKAREPAEPAAINRGDRVGPAGIRRRDAASYVQLAKARFWLGLLYERGHGVAQDFEAAAKWYEMAAQVGNPEAAFNLAVLYEQGRGVAPDRKKAWDWYSAAEARGHPKAAAARERFAEGRGGAAIGVPERRADQLGPRQGDTPPSGLSAAARFEAAVDAYRGRRYAWAAEQFLPLAEAGNVDAQIYVGHMHDQGASGVRSDLAEAIRWYRKAAEQGDAGAQYWLGWVYQSHRFDEEGRQVNDYAQSVRWLKAAAEQGHPEAQLELGNAYREGRGVVQDDAQQNRWYQTSHRSKDGVSRLIQQPQCAAVAGRPEFAAVYAACNRGDEGETSRQLTVLAKQGNAQAQNWLGYLYYKGLPGAWPGTAPYPTTTSGDLFQRGARWIRSAAEQGYAPAQHNLGIVTEHGMGVAANSKEASRWYQAAARQKNAEAQAALKRLGQ